MTAQPTLHSVPPPSTTPTAPPKSRHQKICPCGVCGRDIAVNADGTYRAHGPQESRCESSGVHVRAYVFPYRVNGTTTAHGTCGICGIIREDGHEVASPKNFLKVHNHGRPRVACEGDAYVVTWFRYRTFQWRRRYFPLHEMAMEFATTIKESTW